MTLSHTLVSSIAGDVVGRALSRSRCREQLLLGGLGVDDAKHVVHGGGDVVRRRQAAPFLHLQQSTPWLKHLLHLHGRGE
jgi:hypothetical protein